MELRQKRIWDKRHFKLLDREIWMHFITPTQDLEIKMKYEDLGLETIQVRKKETSLVFAGLIILFAISGKLILKNSDLSNTTDIIILSVISTFIIVVLFLAWTEVRKPLIIIDGGPKTFSLLASSPNKESVDNFILSLQEKIRKRIVQIRVRPNDIDISLDDKKKMLDFLLDEGTLNSHQYNKILDEIKEKHTGKSIIGFNALSNLIQDENKD